MQDKCVQHVAMHGVAHEEALHHFLLMTLCVNATCHMKRHRFHVQAGVNMSLTTCYPNMKQPVNVLWRMMSTHSS